MNKIINGGLTGHKHPETILKLRMAEDGYSEGKIQQCITGT